MLADYQVHFDILPGTSTIFTFIFQPYHNTRIPMSVTAFVPLTDVAVTYWTRIREALGSKLFVTSILTPKASVVLLSSFT
jgi:hypothetical protein